MCLCAAPKSRTQSATMEQIIELFADSISSFIQLSLKLQAANQAPNDALRPAAAAVRQSAEALVRMRSATADWRALGATVRETLCS